MSEGPNAAVLAAILANPQEASEDRLVKLKTAVSKVRDLKLEKKEQEERLKQTNIAIREQEFTILPALMDELEIPSIELGPEGNHPGITAKVENYFHANIAADWPEDKKTEAHKYLEDTGHGDLVRTEVIVSFAKEDHSQALKLANQLANDGYSVAVSNSVHWKTLTAWLKNMVEKKKIMPNLEMIGGICGRIVVLKEKN